MPKPRNQSGTTDLMSCRYRAAAASHLDFVSLNPMSVDFELEAITTTIAGRDPVGSAVGSAVGSVLVAAAS